MSDEKDLAIITYDEARALSTDLAKSNLLSKDFLGKPANVLAQILTGREFKLGPMQSIRGFDVINGKVQMASGMIGALILSSPACEYLTPTEMTAERATYKTKRKGSPEAVTVSYTMEDAKAAGLATKDNYRKNPTAMLLARALSRLGRAVYPDVCHGVYDRDSGELEDAPEKDVTPQAAHVETVKEALRASVTAQKPESVDAEIVEVAPDPAKVDSDKFISEMTTKIKAADEAALRALIPQLKAISPYSQAALKPVFNARKQELQTRPA